MKLLAVLVCLLAGIQVHGFVSTRDTVNTAFVLLTNGQFDEFVARFDDSGVVDDSGSPTPCRGVWKGRVAIAEYFGKAQAQFEQSKFAFEIAAVDEGAGTALVETSTSGRFARSGNSLTDHPKIAVVRAWNGKLQQIKIIDQNLNATQNGYRTRCEKAYFAMLEDLFRYSGSPETLSHFSEDVEFEFVHPPIMSLKVNGVEAFIQAAIDTWAVALWDIDRVEVLHADDNAIAVLTSYEHYKLKSSGKDLGRSALSERADDSQHFQALVRMRINKDGLFNFYSILYTRGVDIWDQFRSPRHEEESKRKDEL